MQKRHTFGFSHLALIAYLWIQIWGFSGPQSFAGMRKHWAAWHPSEPDCGPKNLL